MDTDDFSSIVFEIFEKRITENLKALNALNERKKTFIQAVDKIYQCVKDDGLIMLCGNGGSSSTASHVVNDFVIHMYFRRPPIRAISLVDNTATITALSNDVGYDRIFSWQVECYGNEGDVLLALSTSGNSRNVVLAAEAAMDRNISVIGFTNEDGGQLAEKADIWLPAGTEEGVCSEHMHLFTLHTVCECVEYLLFNDYPSW